MENSIKSIRSCGDCTMCCKVLEVNSMNKGQFQWCPECDIGHGCRIYDNRPAECANFQCLWLYDPDLGPHFCPNKCHFVMYFHASGYFIVDCDNHVRGVHNNSKYMDLFKRMASKLEPRGRCTVVCYGAHMVAITPGETYDLGPTRHSHRIRAEWNTATKQITKVYAVTR